MILEKCAICGDTAEFSDANDNLGVYPDSRRLVQCSNGNCKNASWGDRYWNKNQRIMAEKDEEIRLLKACIFSCLQSDSYEYIKERMELEEKRWEEEAE